MKSKNTRKYEFFLVENNRKTVLAAFNFIYTRSLRILQHYRKSINIHLGLILRKLTPTMSFFLI